MSTIFFIVGVTGWVSLLISFYLYRRIVNERIKPRYLRSKESVEPKVVVIGGGTGQSIFLRGLKYHTKNITAIVTVADDGGGSGVLREDLGMLPPGDIRNCLLALANIEPTMDEVMKYRFTEGGLKGQSFGNLFLAAMNGLYGNFEVAVYKMSQIFAITGKVLPVTLEDINLVAKLKDKSIVKGESNIPKEVKSKNTSIEKVFLEPSNAKPLDEVINSIENADIIVIGPGSLYTSIIPNLLVDGVVDAIKASKAPKVYISNIMTQPGETDEYNVLQHVNAIIKHSSENIIDYVISNNEILPEYIYERYQKDGASQVLLDKGQKNTLKGMGVKSIEENLIEIKNNYIRHDADCISSIIVDLALSHKNDTMK
ncbi:MULTISPECIES: gluconeogenesis factor YvcK family protein [Romboutsia]|uniref:Putative gluconeogenesis factor n=1 Tax=Romboutsia hominis TaxID=1507512 RepID=A0A2P2BMM0_9FIRM|nr:MULTISPECIES: gluconeogenesis factor YvcK family protein [Romboutsia]MCH1958672.1 YvcK family protein [Romboutsia hominis]MCH1970588.1 YvcK family protein [Romboutsia hominis]MDB8789283.1 YvcK family protein [Romboutsia sp. 1001216sp1]MDB8793285.1 YvcK family protein [Romboutsia sp. 1001216sp1]MDB8796077.1 YvcK family protein [Romboutsia sp. 1001216sp1]